MTDRDVLDRASEALRKSGEPGDEELARLRARILRDKVKPLGTRRLTRNVRWLLPLAAAFLAATALAATPGAWEGMLGAAERFLNIELLAPAPKVATQRTERRAQPRVREAEAAPTPLAEPEAQPLAEPEAQPRAEPEPEPSESDTRPTSRATTARPRKTERGAPTPTLEEERTKPVAAREPSVPSEDLTLYKRAHVLHFRERNHTLALSAWDTYLARKPHGTFVVEARYNRALCLVRLGRYAEAREALGDFAEGKVGGYRQEEAARIIEALDKRP